LTRRVRQSGLALAASVFFLFAGCKRPIDETRSVSFDPETSDGLLGPGWSGYEATPEGDSFAWAQARRVSLRVLSRGDDDRLVRFRAWPYRYAGAPAQNVTLFVNDARVETAPMGDGPRVYTFLAPKAAFKEGANDVRLEFTYAEAPRDREPGAGDTRTLAAAFDWLELLPPRPAAGAAKS
jgi:hypothetical protein